MKRKKCRKALKFQEISAFIYSVTVKDGIISSLACIFNDIL